MLVAHLAAAHQLAKTFSIHIRKEPMLSGLSHSKMLKHFVSAGHDEAVIAQWYSTARCPGVDSWQLLAFHFHLKTLKMYIF